MKNYVLLFITLCFFTVTYAQTGAEKVSKETEDRNYDGTIEKRKTLTGNWGGLRTNLKEKGVYFKIHYSNYFQGMVSGEGSNDFEYGGKLAFTTAFNGEKLGLWKGFFAIARMEYNVGHSVNRIGGSVLPVNTALAYPGIEGADRWDMNMYLIQFLSKTDKIVLGKINNIDLGNFSSFSGGLGIRNFWNNAFVGPPNGISVPYVFGAYYMSNKEKRDFVFAFYDSNSRINKMGFEDLFTDGVTFFSSFNFNTKFFNKKGKQGITGVVSTKEVKNLDNLDHFFPPGGNYLGEKSNRWSLLYFFEQTLYQNPNNEKQSLGIFGQIGITDGKANYADHFYQIGFGGKSFIPKRSKDHWGLAYFNLALNDGLSGFKLPPIPPTGFQGLEINDRESGIEFFYEAQITNWVSLGIDYQYIVPGVKKAFGYENSNTSYLGFRSLIKF